MPNQTTKSPPSPGATCSPSFVPFDATWKKEVMKLPKLAIVDMYRKTCQQKLALAEECVEAKKTAVIMAMLAAETPQFDNPIVVWDAKKLRDRILAENVRGEARRAELRIGTEGLSPSPPPTCSVLAGGVRVHRASSNDATLPKPVRPRKRKIRDARKIIAALSPGGLMLPATSRQGSCPNLCHRSRQHHLADHGPAPTGSNRPLSRNAGVQARCKSKALGESAPPARNQSLASQILDKGIRTQE